MPVVHVAVGVILDDRNNILITRRADDAHQGGLWEFPGGKVEPGESVQQALARELLEELDISVESASPLLDIHHDYSDKSVLLDVWLVEKFLGQPEPREGQPMLWVGVDELPDYAFPAANTPIITAVRQYLSA